MKAWMKHQKKMKKIVVPRRFSLTKLALLALPSILLGSAKATVLTFDISGPNPLSGGTPLDPAYGDRVTSTIDGVTGWEYGGLGGMTPNIVVDYNGGIDLWGPGYGDLINVLGHQQFAVPGSVDLVPDAGYDVVLNSFDIGGWNLVDYEGSVRILDGMGMVLYDSGTVTFPGDAHLTFPPSPIQSDTGLKIDLVFFGDNGIDNINFSQSPAVPEPSQVTLLVLGLTICNLRRRR